ITHSVLYRWTKLSLVMLLGGNAMTGLTRLESFVPPTSGAKTFCPALIVGAEVVVQAPDGTGEVVVQPGGKAGGGTRSKSSVRRLIGELAVPIRKGMLRVFDPLALEKVTGTLSNAPHPVSLGTV